VNASVSKGSGFEKGNSQFYTDTEISAGKTLTLNSGRDTTLTGAQAGGETVKASVGGDLILNSQQVTDKYDSGQKSLGVSGSGGLGNGSLSVNASKSSMHSDYQSVDKQTGINAGKGGFDITVGDHTQLNGAAIRSEAGADRNTLDTGTLGFSDINNKAEYRVEQQSAGFSSGGDIGGKLISNTARALLAGVNHKGKDSNTTRSAVAEGEIVVRDQESQKQDVAELSRDTDNAHKKLDTIFDKEAEQKRIDRNQLLGEIGQQITDIGVTGAKIKATEDARHASDTDREAARKVLASENKNSDPAAVNDYLIQQSINDSGWGVGGDYARLVGAGTALTQGLANGDINSAVANASAPYIANAIGQYVDGMAGKLAAHAIANVALALAKDENALSQASGAVTAEAMGMLSLELYNKRPSQLTEDEKSTLSAFASLAAGIAGGLSGGSLSDAGNAAQAGKTTIENNLFGMPSGMTNYGQAVASWNQYAADNNLTPEQTQEGMNRIAIGKRPSWGIEYKVRPYVKGEAAGGAGAGYYFDTSIDPYQISANRGETLAVGGRVSGQIGIQFGPYFPGTIDSGRNSSMGLGLGIASGEISYGKDGLGFSFGVGPAWGWSGVSTNIAGEKVDINGSSGTEFYHHDFNQDKAK